MDLHNQTLHAQLVHLIPFVSGEGAAVRRFLSALTPMIVHHAQMKLLVSSLGVLGLEMAQKKIGAVSTNNDTLI